MPIHRVAIFRPYPLAPSQKIHIQDGPRRGDWEVLACDEKSLRVRCPVSGRELDWKPFYALVGEKETEWPAKD